MNFESKEIWVLAQHRHGSIEEPTFGLISEGRRLLGRGGRLTAVVLGVHLEEELKALGSYGADKVLWVKDERLHHFQGELYSRVIAELVKKDPPLFILMAQSPETMDVAPRLAALLETGLVTRAMDLTVDAERRVTAIRPISNGYLFEEVEFQGQHPFIISFMPWVLAEHSPDPTKTAEVTIEPLGKGYDDLKIEVKALIQPDPETLDLEEADLIVSGGRGVGKGEMFQIIHDLGKALGGSVSGTRPVIDWQMLPYERQIGQTGKTVTPRLLVACGISGANEYTAGMEKSQLVIAINTDPRARIFRFADLGVVGDVHKILPLLIRRLKEV